MNYTWLITRIRSLLQDSRSEWAHYKSLNYSEKLIRQGIIFPMLILLGFSHFAGIFFAEGKIHFASAFWFTLAHIISIYSGYYLSSNIIAYLGKNFNADLPKNIYFQYTAVSMIPYMLLSVLINLAPASLYFLKLFYLASIFLLWQGSKELLEIKENKQLSFVLISLFIIYAIIQTTLILCIRVFPISTINPV